MTTSERLRTTIERLEAAYERDRAELVEEGYGDPELVRDTSGRFVLLDALTAIVNARAALALTEEVEAS
ncbi:hypothetical protein [Actinomadura nitritigenes]|uniref:hypothetical protein n=1 Tax=Actinomadura nitritigenes TaxID=134602 RepID=UPI003D8F61E5